MFVSLAEVRALEAQLTSLAANLDVDALDAEAAVAIVESLTTIERLASGTRMLVLPRAVAGGVWRRSGDRRPEDWLARKAGTSPGAARSTIDTGERLTELRETSEAVRKGEVSAEQASVVSDAADADPDAEGDLLDLAKRSTPINRLKREAERRKVAAQSRQSQQERYRRIHANRGLRTWTERDGTFRLEARLTPDAGAQVKAALAPHQQAAFDKARADGLAEGADAYAADALVAMAQASIAAGPASKLPEARLVIRVDLPALDRGWVQRGETCEIDGAGPIPVDIARSYATEAFWAVVVADAVDVRTVSHLGRQVTAAQRSALEARDPCCVVPGCGATGGLQIDHVADWHLTFRTHIDHLARLCRHHHRLKTVGAATLERLADGRWRYTVHGGEVRVEPPATAADDQLALVG